jgi:hypothetical protein
MSVSSENAPLIPLTSEEMDAYQEVMCDRPPVALRMLDIFDYSEDNLTFLNRPDFVEWRDAMTAKFNRQYLMLNFLQYAWKQGHTYENYPYTWKKINKKPTTHKEDPLTVVGEAFKTMKQLDKDAPIHHYLAVFYFYQIPIYHFHQFPEKRLVRGGGGKSRPEKKVKLSDKKKLAEVEKELALLKAQKDTQFNPTEELIDELEEENNTAHQWFMTRQKDAKFKKSYTSLVAGYVASGQSQRKIVKALYNWVVEQYEKTVEQAD